MAKLLNLLRRDNAQSWEVQYFETSEEQAKMYFKDNEKEIYRFCKEHYILINSFSLKTLLFRYLKENENNEKIINLKTLEVIKKVVK